MRRFHGASLPHALAIALALTSVLALANCGGKVVCESGSCGDTAIGVSSNGGGYPGTTAAGNPSACTLPIDPPGTPFTFHVHNGGTLPYHLNFGCGDLRPIDLVTPDGLRSIGSDIYLSCGPSCDTVDLSNYIHVCKDCIGADNIILPGATFDISWDHRVYGEYTIAPACVNGDPNAVCALAKTLAPSPSQEGVLTGCRPYGDDPGYCPSIYQTSIKFTVDTTGVDAIIELN